MTYKVHNRSTSTVVYNIPELNIRREYSPGESKEIDEKELEALRYQPGGTVLMNQFLQISANEETLNRLNVNPEPEYFLNEKQIVKLLEEGSLDEFLDCLDFAPNGVIDLIKKFAVQLPLNDVAKRQALKDKKGFDVDLAIKNTKLADTDVAETKPTRRVISTNGTKSAARRTTTTKKPVVEE